jgi:D-hydroxyproline dehydrogenase subunit beta
MSIRSADAIVIGAGVIGAAVAYYLSLDGLRTLVVEQEFASAGATGGAMGHIVVMDDSAAQLALTTWSQELLRELLPDLPAACDADRCGTLWIAEDDAQLEAARAKLEVYTNAGVRAELLDAAAVAEAEPALRPGLSGALRVPGDMVVYPPALAQWLLSRAAEHGASVRTDAQVVSIEDEPAAVRLANGERLSAGLVVNAAGAHAPRLTPWLEIIPRKGHLVVTERYAGFCRHQLVEVGYLRSAHTLTAASVAFNLQPRPGGQILVGSSRELVGWEPRVNREVVSRMLTRATSFVPGLAALTAIRTWAAFRPATPDHLPYIGQLEDAGSVWVAAGHEGLGITTALGTGTLIADGVAGRSSTIDAAPYSPARTRQERSMHA